MALAWNGQPEMVLTWSGQREPEMALTWSGQPEMAQPEMAQPEVGVNRVRVLEQFWVKSFNNNI